MNRIMRSRRFGLRLIRPAPVLAMLLTACELPLPITQDVVAAAEDNILPVITITSPADNSIFSSTTIIKGKVSDHALKNGDNLGSLSSLSVVAGQNRAQKGKILIDTAGKVSAVGPADPSGGDAKITYSADTGDFGIEMDTEDLDRGSINVRITALDRNGNSGVSLLTLVSDAPLVMFKDKDGDSERQLPQDELIGQIHIEGTIADNKENPNSIEEISSVSFDVRPVGGKFKIELDKMTLNKDKDSEYYETSIDRLYAPGTAEDAKFILNTNGTFSSSFMVRDQDRDKVKNSRSLEIKIEVTDRNGRSDYKTYSITAAEKVPEIRIAQPALSATGKDRYYYSSKTKAFYLNGEKQTEKGKILFKGSVSPNGGPKGPEVIELKLREQDGKIRELDLTPTFKDDLTVPGDKTFERKLSLGTVPGSPSGNFVLRLVAKDKNGFIATVIREFIDDKTPPNAFSDLEIVRGASEVKYAKAGDSVTLKFSAISDTGAGVDLTSLKILGTHDDDSYNKELDEKDKTKDISLDIKFPAATSPRSLSPYTSEDIKFTMSVEDNVENPTTGFKNFKYYHTAPASATLKVTQQLGPGFVTASAGSPVYLKAGDTIRASFESSRDLNLDKTKISFQLDTKNIVPSRINKTSGTVNNTYWYDYTILAADPNTRVGWKLKYVDLAENRRNYPPSGAASTHFTVDTKLPSITAKDFDINGVSGAANAGIGDKINLRFTIDEDQKDGVSPVVKLTTPSGDITSTATPTMTTPGDRKEWQVQYTVPQSTTSTGPLTLRSVLNPQRVTPEIRVEDKAGNTKTIRFSKTLDIDNTLPAFSAASPPTIKSDKTGSSSGTKAGIGDTITVNFTLSESQETGINPVVSLQAATGGRVDNTPVVTPVAGTDRKEWKAVFEVPEAGTGTPEYLGSLTLKVTATDAFGNVNDALNNPFPAFSIDNTRPKFDETPTIKSSNTTVGVDKPSTKAGIDDTITVNFTLSEPHKTGSAPRVSLRAAAGGKVDNTPAVTPVAGTGRKEWKAAFTVRESGTGRPATPEYSGDLTFNAVATDEFGNESDALSQVFRSDKFTIDNTRPTVTGTPRLASSSTKDTSKVSATDNEATVTFSAADTGSGILASLSDVKFKVGSTSVATATVTETVSGNYRAVTHPLTAGSPQGVMTVTVRVVDEVGNSASRAVSANRSIRVDTVAPAFSTGGTPMIKSSNTTVGVDKPSTKAGIDDTITVNFTLSEPHKTGSAPRVSLRAAAGGKVDNTPAVTPVAGTGRKEWKAAFTVRESGTGRPATPEYSGDLTFNAVATDEFGNESDALSQVFRSDKFTIDNTRPTFTDPPTVTTMETSTSATGIKQYPSGAVIEIKVTDVSDDARSVEFGFTGTGAPATRYSAGKGTDNMWSSYDASAGTSRPPVTLPTSTGQYRVTVKVVDGHGNEKNVTTRLQIEVIP